MITADDIRAARASLGESQAAFGARFCVNQWTISRWETRGPPISGIVQDAICRVLDEMKRAHPEAFSVAPQVGEGGGEAGGGEAASGHGASVPQPDTEISANGQGDFA